MARRATIIESLESTRMLGGLPCFRTLSSWSNWIVFLLALYGLPMTTAQEQIFCTHTGRSRYVRRDGGFPEAAAIVGRQAGKDRIGSAIQAYEAISAEPQADGTELYSLNIAQDSRASLRTAFRYVTAPFEVVPAFRRFVLGRKTGAWTLQNNVVLANYPCVPESIRGIRACVAILTELAFFRSTDNTPVDKEMLRAIRPTVATTGGKIIILSSPYGQYGELHELHRRHFGRDDSDVLVWQATAPQMNPTLPPDYLQRMERDDPEAYRSEVLGEFRAGLSTFLDPENLAACVETGMHERPRYTGQSYRFFWDPASGSGKDSFVVAGAHWDRHSKRAILDVVRSWTPPFNPTGAMAEACALMRTYGVSDAFGDRYAPGFVLEQCRAHDMQYHFSEKDRSQLYLELLPLVNAQQVNMLDHADLLRQLRGLERRRGSSGRDRVDHAPGQHDDLANAAAGALVLAAEAGKFPEKLISYPGEGLDETVVPTVTRGDQEIDEAIAREIVSTRRGFGRWFQ